MKYTSDKLIKILDHLYKEKESWTEFEKNKNFKKYNLLLKDIKFYEALYNKIVD